MHSMLRLSLFLLLAVAACSDRVSVPVNSFKIKVVGVVQDLSGARRPAATVNLQILSLHDVTGATTRGQCRGLPYRNDSDQSTTSGNDGSFAFTVSGFNPPFYTCVFLDASAVVGGKTLTGVTEVDSVLVGGGPSGTDSLTVTVVLKP
jgi:hypothetical protein